MQRELYEVEKDRFDLKDSSLYHLQGTWPKDHKPEAVLDGEKLPAAISAQERVSALERFKDLDLVNGKSFPDAFTTKYTAPVTKSTSAILAAWSNPSADAWNRPAIPINTADTI